MPLLQAVIPDTLLERLEQHRLAMEFPPTRKAVVVCAICAYLDAKDAEKEPVPVCEVAHD